MHVIGIITRSKSKEIWNSYQSKWRSSESGFNQSNDKKLDIPSQRKMIS